MNIWFNPNLSIDDLRQVGDNNMGHHLGLKWEEVGSNFLKMSMPVDERTKQPYGLLHGGASCVLAETVGSVASQLVVNPEKFICVGLEINANHVRSAKQGIVIATCTPIHLGASTHVWDIKIYDEREKLICVSRLTTAVLKKPL
jgi:1,4-dihydroxy-2-naphthoyl-CoA hydrolase